MFVSTNLTFNFITILSSFCFYLLLVLHYFPLAWVYPDYFDYFVFQESRLSQFTVYVYHSSFCSYLSYCNTSECIHFKHLLWCNLGHSYRHHCMQLKRDKNLNHHIEWLQPCSNSCTNLHLGLDLYSRECIRSLRICQSQRPTSLPGHPHCQIWSTWR